MGSHNSIWKGMHWNWKCLNFFQETNLWKCFLILQSSRSQWVPYTSTIWIWCSANVGRFSNPIVAMVVTYFNFLQSLQIRILCQGSKMALCKCAFSTFGNCLNYSCLGIGRYTLRIVAPERENTLEFHPIKHWCCLRSESIMCLTWKWLCPLC